MAKKYIKVTDNDDLNEEFDDDFEVMDISEDESFVKKHKKGFIIGGLCVLAAGLGAVIAKCAKKSKDDDEDYYYDDDFDDEHETEEDETK